MNELSDPPPQTPEIHKDSAKSRQIMEGARAVFLERGFDAASMGEIARRAGVSKGTLYVYFQSKEELFETIFEAESRAQAEQVFSLDHADHDVEAVLTRLGRAFVRFLCQPGRLSPLRTVISIAGRMPDLGQRFYDAGPATGVGRLRDYLETQCRAGTLVVEDCEIAAAQFLDACQSTLFKPMMFASAPPPSEERIRHVVGVAVRCFLAAYLPRA
ncbi:MULTISPECIES: TetR/AcrR family transcriptional regulator [Rhodomicrobium]|uniref:TetR/AcrR family transcriptional regulator n=1 Tax=Rhodomicrobium TaxID=1068 RepID=UPI000B4AFFF1|nr:MULTISPECIES: TetR/AcrR family transcriptional regulator [Rhodomicrobium]